MSEAEEEREHEQERKFSLGRLQIDRRFLVIAIILLISIISISFSTQKLFGTDISDWSITRGAFEGDNGNLKGASLNVNWAYHESETAYGVWDWYFRYYGHGSASVIFIGLNQDTDFYSHCLNGYKLEIEVQKPFALQRLDDGQETTLVSAYFIFEAQTTYRIRVIRNEENNFTVSINGNHQFSVVDSTYNTSEVFELDWVHKQSLESVSVTDYVGEADWTDYFSDMPTAESTNVFTKIALYAPFVALGLVILFYVIQLLLTEGSWTRFLLPLFLSIIIGVGVGYLFEFLRDVVPEPDISSISIETETTYNITSETPISSPLPSSNNTGGGGGVSPIVPPIEKRPVSIALLVISSIFILVMIGFVMFDFFRRREEEYHEQIVQKDVRWLPKVTESDHRKRVIRAYHKASYDLIDHGVKSERSMTPGEFEVAAKTKFEETEEPFTDLTDLYEEARFSEHEIIQEKSLEAEKRLEELSTKLKKTRVKKDDETDESSDEEEIEERD